jgi:hypothetical protein
VEAKRYASFKDTLQTTINTTNTTTEPEDTSVNPLIHIPCDLLTTVELQQLSEHCSNKNAVFFMHGDKIQFLTLVDRMAAKEFYKL